MLASKHNSLQRNKGSSEKCLIDSRAEAQKIQGEPGISALPKSKEMLKIKWQRQVKRKPIMACKGSY